MYGCLQDDKGQGQVLIALSTYKVYCVGKKNLSSLVERDKTKSMLNIIPLCGIGVWAWGYVTTLDHKKLC